MSAGVEQEVSLDRLKVKLLFTEARLADAHQANKQKEKEIKRLKKTLEDVQATFPVGDVYPKKGKLRCNNLGYCFLCANLADVTKHHVIPRSYGGRIQINLCRACHKYVHETYSNLQLVGMTWKQVRDELLKAPIPAPKSMKEKK